MKRRLVSATLLVVLSTMSAPTTLAQVSTAEPIALVMTAGAVPGVKASDPNPPDGAEGVTAPLLEWTAGETAAFHDVYFGTNPTPGPAEFIMRHAYNVYWHLHGLTPGTTYYWRIDEIEEDGTTIHTGDVWSFTAAPYTAYNPDPPDGAENVPTNTDLSWTGGFDAITHDVYFGTDHTEVANGTGGTFKGNQPDVVYEPGTLQMGSTYYWRIDEIEPDGTTIHTGDVWSFTAAGAVPGVKASDPNPPDGAAGVTSRLLQWTAGETAKWHDVYLGTNPTPGAAEHKGRLFSASSMWFEAGGWIAGETYYWRIDEIEEDGTTIHTGDVWSFTAAPYTAYNPDPPDGAENVPTNTDLSWTGGFDAITHDVYFGTDHTEVANGTGGTFKGNQPDVFYEPGTLQMGFTYYWRIDEIDAEATKYTGDVWSFTAAGAVPGVKASDPNPPDGAEGVTAPLLEWTAGETAAFHDVYFGTNPTPGPAEFIMRHAYNVYWHLHGLTPGTTYYWRIDEIEEDGTTIHTGDVWSFTALPSTASSPDPPDGAKNVPTDTDLSWTPGFDAITHDVYFGTNYADVAGGTGGTFKGNQPDTTYEVGTLWMGTMYFWRIDEIDEIDHVKHVGNVWSFTTVLPGLVGLEIMGPDEVVEESSAQYNAVARYEDGSTKDVTVPATWSLDPPGYASIDENGLLTSAHVDTPAIVTIYAEYTEGDVTVSAEKAVWCVPSEGKIYHVDALNGDDNNDGLSPETAFATIQTAIDSAEDVPQPVPLPPLPPRRRGPAPAEPTTITILVYPGVYAEAINFKGKAITLASAQDAAILEAPGDYAVSFYSGEGRASVLKNFVICNSYLGIFIVDSSPTISNVTVVDNKFGIAAYADADPDISSSIFWDNADGDLSGCQARYSCIEQVSQGEGNISITDPLFADRANGDYHLLSRRGRYVPAHGLWSFDDVTSPCVDAGDPAVDPSNERMPHSGRINMGAYGGTAYASLSEWPIASDLNRDGVVDPADLSIFCQQWLMELPSGRVVPEDNPPVPNPAQWDPDGEPREVFGGGGTFDYWVEMRATEAADASGWVEYFFECTTQPAFSSGWQRSPEYRVPVGRQGQPTRFRVKARDLYGNETAWSVELQALTPT